jgi:membrane protein YdbS with pleckstrin-like domain
MSDSLLESATGYSATEGDGDWRALPPKAAELAMIGGAISGLLLGLACAAFVAWPLLVAWPVLSWPVALALLATLVLALIVLAMWIAYRRWQSTRWKLDDTGLHLRRGRLWRKEILIPRSRVQHLDIERGPIERHFGVATLIVHTAGTRQHAVRQSGLPDGDAVALRDALVPASGLHDDVL